MTPTPKTTTYAVTLACLALAVAGCGSSGQGKEPANADGAGPQDYSAGQGPAGGPGGPGGSGKVAAVSGSTAQVQNEAGQVAVSWTNQTTFTQEVVSSAAALEVGDCVVALPAKPSTSGSGEDETDGPVTAATVRITAPVGGSCAGGMRREGPREEGPERDAPQEPPTGDGSDGAPKDGLRRVAGPGAFGKVTAVTGSGFTVESAQPDSDSTTSTDVTTTAETSWTTTRPATARAVTVGRCVTSMGRPDSTGAITADSIVVSSPVDGECAAGPGVRVMERTS